VAVIAHHQRHRADATGVSTEKTQAALPNEGAVLRVFFGLWISGQMKLHRITGHRDIRGKEKAAA
jgi:hypothetical protein